MCNVYTVLIYVEYICCSASKKKTKEQSKTSGADATDPDFSSLPLTRGMGQPIKGQPIDDEMIAMEGSSNIPPASVVQTDAQSGETDSGKVAKDDL